MNDLYLYEWKWEKLPPGFDIPGFKQYLTGIWENRSLLYFEKEEEINEEEISDLKRYKQGFVRFDDEYISAKNYVGFIQYDGVSINILPKVFAKSVPDPASRMHYITSNLLHWLRYSTRLRFPFSDVSFEEQKFDHFLEPFIFIYAEFTNKLLEQLPFQRFEEITEATSFLKGRLAVNEYIGTSLVTGNNQRIISNYESFQFDNLFNQILKFVSRVLLTVTENGYSRRRLQNILFMLDEVEDRNCIEKDCNKVTFNRLYDEWQPILNMCKMFLSGNSFRSQSIGNPNFCFLVPMELVYEEYIVGVIEKYSFKQVLRQPRFKFLTDCNTFQLKPDIIYNDSIIIDTKYKELDENSADGKYGVSQQDLYQMMGYAVRYEKDKIILLYPYIKKQDDCPVKKVKSFFLTDEFSNQKISIQIKEVNILEAKEKELYPFILL
ncbi:MAG TPA: hypothetical protein PKC72_08890 [Chitinophagaceae bacterium]|nr:hypothetical protein [Chitinophagaceae bacterium]